MSRDANCRDAPLRGWNTVRDTFIRRDVQRQMHCDGKMCKRLKHKKKNKMTTV